MPRRTRKGTKGPTYTTGRDERNRDKVARRWGHRTSSRIGTAKPQFFPPLLPPPLLRASIPPCLDLKYSQPPPVLFSGLVTLSLSLPPPSFLCPTPPPPTVSPCLRPLLAASDILSCLSVCLSASPPRCVALRSITSRHFMAPIQIGMPPARWIPESRPRGRESTSG